MDGLDVNAVAGVLRALENKPASFAGVVPANSQAMLDAAANSPAALSDLPALKGLLGAFTAANSSHGQWLAVFIAESAREDPQVLEWCSKAWGGSAAEAQSSFATLHSFINHCERESVAADKTAFLLSSLVMVDPQWQKMLLQREKFSALLSPQISQVGKLDALANMLRIQSERRTIWESYVAPLVECVSVNSAPPLLYKSIFCIWLMSFSPASSDAGWVLKLLKSVIVSCRVEKIVRVALLSLQNFLKSEIAKDVVEIDALQALIALEYEKWRDQDVYDAIKTVKELLEAETSKYTNFDRYMSELQTGQLTWSFIHTEKFWIENVNKFDQKDFEAVKLLCALIAKVSTDETSLAVACHDIGEFARLFPAGKKVCKRYGAQSLVMDKMNHHDRQVAREALLCTQKLMLHKWQEVAVE